MILLVDDLGADVKVFRISPCGILLAHTHSEVGLLGGDGSVLLNCFSNFGHVVHKAEIAAVVAETDVFWQILALAHFLHLPHLRVVEVGYVGLRQFAAVDGLVDCVLYYRLEVGMRTNENLRVGVVGLVEVFLVLLQPCHLPLEVVSAPRSAEIMGVVGVEVWV